MKDLFKISLRYGLIGSALLIIMFLVFYFSDENPLQELQMFDLFVIPIFIFFGLKEFRDRYNGTFLKYWEGMTGGLILYTSMALITAGFVYTFVELIDPSLVPDYVSSRLEILEETRTKIVEEMGADSYIQSYQKVKDTTQTDILLDGFLKKIIIGFLITSVVSVVLKRKAPKA
ncbi:hypothetical protein BFP72_13695 [Reichenbachiella sp. 5M10]|uniref:DUF4199 domain-containing protein n=1 Tax=Reichenbachiella sp. 5M10 TaxID=1889772 RepID=UPI000C155E52|nr:DUF4199 domain-containing protein [Reichenbachiella sp. 5M10]PIB36373.1 hypothetical protein BFP72_13695 [Reichenbachiella sp. 5M10]